MTASSPFITGARAALPIVGGYLPVAVTFGIVAAEGGLAPVETVAASAIVFSGAAQFLLVGMRADALPATTILGLLIAINARHLFYGPPIARRLPASRPGLAPVIAHGLTDEVFALSLTGLDRQPEARRWGWFAGVAAAAWAAWVAGTALGAAAGGALAGRGAAISATLEFALPALFVILLMPHFKGTVRLGMAAAFSLGAIAKLAGAPNAGIPAAAIAGTLVWYGAESWTRRSSS
ncbi:MAG: AzlC family ABC transporter permease [Azospirillaceae bacterium]